MKIIFTPTRTWAWVAELRALSANHYTAETADLIGIRVYKNQSAEKHLYFSLENLNFSFLLWNFIKSLIEALCRRKSSYILFVLDFSLFFWIV